MAIVKPEEFGAFGDGLHDDTQAIQAAANTGLILRLSPKTYRIDGTVIIENNPEIDGGKCTIVGTGAPKRRTVFEIRSKGIDIHDVNGIFESDSHYSADSGVPGNNIILFKLFSDGINIHDINTTGAFSTVFLTDTDARIKKNIRIRNITANEGNMNIFLRYAEKVFIENVDLSITTYCSDYHPIYVCSHVCDVSISNVSIKGYRARDLISLHPSSSAPQKYNIKNIHFSNITLEGKYEYGMVFRYCRDITVDGLKMTYDKRTVDGSLFSSVVEGYNIRNVIIRNANCVFLGNLCKVTTPLRNRNGVNILFEDSHFTFNYTPIASHVLIQYACNTHFRRCVFTSEDDKPTTLIVGSERSLNAHFENCLFKPKRRGLLADMRGGRVYMRGMRLENIETGITAIKNSGGILKCIDCSAIRVAGPFTDKK